ncbi:MAG: hypothetical protein B6243_08520 [Anaerolineaceae bacterium 4572_5.2]|nr:MAG: hypothetical protein B6243_08520 [Anaerolineaceae bacterium 4572_5.2]
MTIRLSNKPLQACLRQDQLDILLKYEMKRDELGSNIAAGEQQFTAGDHLTQVCSVLRLCHCEAHFAEAIPALQTGDCFVPCNDTHRIFRAEQPCHPTLKEVAAKAESKWQGLGSAG